MRPLKFNADGTAIYLLSNQGRDKIALVRLDVATGNETVLYAHPEVDMNYVQISPTTLDPVLAYIQPDYPQAEVLDPSLRELVATFREHGLAGIYISSVDDAQQLITVNVNDNREVAYYLLDLRNKSTILLGKCYSHDFSGALATMKPIRVHARDCLALNGYLPLPETTKRPLPMVLLVHGGLFARDIWQFSRQAQFLANRGDAVLQINYRGSIGYGRDFMEAAYGEFAGINARRPY